MESKANNSSVIQVKWLHAMGTGCDPQAFRCACMRGHIEVAKRLKANCSRCQEGSTQDSDQSIAQFIETSYTECCGVGGHLEMLEWLLQGYDIGSSLYRLIYNAITTGCQNCLQLLVSQPDKYRKEGTSRRPKLGLPGRRDNSWNPLMTHAVIHGRLEMLPTLSILTGDASCPSCLTLDGSKVIHSDMIIPFTYIH